MPRTTKDRIQDALHRLRTDTDCWVPSADPSGRVHIVPLSFLWNNGRITLATQAQSATARNLIHARRARLAIGDTRDVVLVDGRTEIESITAIDARVANDYVKVGWDPRLDPGNLFIHVQPDEIQAWRDVDELAGRVIMRNGEWQA